MYHAHWTEAGTRQERYADAATLEELDKMIYGKAAAPKWNSITIWKDKEEDKV